MNDQVSKQNVVFAEGNLRIETASQILEKKFQEELWGILEKAKTFTDLLSPWRQNLNHDEFITRVEHKDTLLFLMYEGEQLIGFTFNTNNLELAPWLNLKFFKHNCPRLFEQKLIWCNIGIVVRLDKQDKGYLKRLITETWDFGASEGRIMIVDFSWRIFGDGDSWIGHTLKYGKGVRQKAYQYKIYEKQQFAMCWVEGGVTESQELSALIIDKPLFGKK